MKSIAQITSETIVLAGRLSRLNPGEIVTYAELANLCSLPVNSAKFKSTLQSAKRKAERDQQILIDCVRKQGLKRLEANEMPAIGTAAIEKNRRNAGRTQRRMVHAAAKTTPTGPALTQFNMCVSVLGALREMSGRKSIEAATQLAQSSNSVVPTAKVLQETLKAFSGTP